MLSDLNRGYVETHLILDLGAPNFMPLEGFFKFLKGMIGRIPSLDKWKTFSIIGTSFPENMGGIKEGVEILPRNEWTLYEKLTTELKREDSRLPSFGDYGISHPAVLQMDMRKVKPSATIRYTIDNEWCIVKGKNTRDYGFAQYYELSAKLIKSRYYCGPDFSFGDDYIKKCAEKKIPNAGNLPRWRQVGTNHHIEKVVRDLANFHDFLELL